MIGGRHITEVAFMLHAHPAQVQITAKEFFSGKISNADVLIDSNSFDLQGSKASKSLYWNSSE